METPIALGPNLKLIRKKWKINQTDFAEMLDVNPGKMSSYETSNAEPKIITLIRLEDITGIPIYDLYTRLLSEKEISDNPRSEPMTKEEREAARQFKNEPNLVKRLEELEKLTNELYLNYKLQSGKD